MCAIAGGEGKREVSRMLRLMRHRAPDGEASYGDVKYTIGMGRLAIIDLVSDGLFPYVEENYILTFNGEIYNYKELRLELEQRGWVFRTTSDAEVLLKSYREWGKDCLDKFNGMFAFAIYDGNTIFLARDLAGEKPLYYREKPFAFASEAKALKWDCKEFPKASYGIYDFNTFKIKKWWEFKERQIDLSSALEELEWLIGDAIRLRLRSDVPMALYYSGGIDSSLIATYAPSLTQFQWQDGDFADEFRRLLPKIVWHLDYPSTSFSPFGQWKLAEAASKGFKVVVTGEGADELFGGYIRYVSTANNYEGRKRFPSYKGLFASDFKDVNEQGMAEFDGNLQTLLRQNDRMASAWGLENRTPFLDRRIIEFAFSLPPELKICGFDTKILLRRILLRRNPFYQDMEKVGLYCSIPAWLGETDRLSKKKYMALQEKIWKRFTKK